MEHANKSYPICVTEPKDLSQAVTCAEDFQPILLNGTTKTNFYVLSIVAILLCIATVLQNSVVFMAMLSMKRFLADGSITNRFLITLTFVDLMLGLFVAPFYIHFSWLISEGRFCCDISRAVYACGYSSLLISMTTITFITVELLLAITCPFVYQNRLNRTCSLPLFFVITLTWTVATFVFLYYLRSLWEVYRLVTSSLMLVVFVSICFCHWYIYKEVMKVKRRSSSNQSLSCRGMREKTVKLASSVLVTFGLCYLPYVVLALHMEISGPNAFRQSYFEPWGEFIAGSNVFWDPLIYCVRFHSIRSSIKSMFRRAMHFCGSKEKECRNTRSRVSYMESNM